MILKKEKDDEMIVLDLTGSDGNAFVLLGVAKRLSDKFGMDWETIKKEMMSGNYENLVEVFEEYFGEFVIMYR